MGACASETKVAETEACIAVTGLINCCTGNEKAELLQVCAILGPV